MENKSTSEQHLMLKLRTWGFNKINAKLVVIKNIYFLPSTFGKHSSFSEKMKKGEQPSLKSKCSLTNDCNVFKISKTLIPQNQLKQCKYYQ